MQTVLETLKPRLHVLMGFQEHGLLVVLRLSQEHNAL